MAQTTRMQTQQLRPAVYTDSITGDARSPETETDTARWESLGGLLRTGVPGKGGWTYRIDENNIYAEKDGRTLTFSKELLHQAGGRNTRPNAARAIVRELMDASNAQGENISTIFGMGYDDLKKIAGTALDYNPKPKSIVSEVYGPRHGPDRALEGVPKDLINPNLRREGTSTPWATEEELLRTEAASEAASKTEPITFRTGAVDRSKTEGAERIMTPFNPSDTSWRDSIPESARDSVMAFVDALGRGADATIDRLRDPDYKSPTEKRRRDEHRAGVKAWANS